MDYSGIFHNCLSVQEKDGVYTLKRFSDKLLKFYADEKDIFEIRSQATVGIKMEFYTNSETISFDFEATEPFKNCVNFDIVENDVLTQNICYEEYQQHGSITYNKIYDGKSKIEIYLPTYCKAYIKNINLGEFETISRKKSLNYLAIGDSITQGVLSDLSSLNYVNLLAKEWNAEVLNNGVGGYYFNPNSIDEDLDFAPDIITVAYGTNDAVRDTDFHIVSKDIDNFFAKLQQLYHDKEVFIITPIWRSNLTDEKKQDQFNQIQEMLPVKAKAFNLHCIDGLKLVPHTRKLYAPDLTHPNMVGFEEMARNLNKEIQNILNEK